MPNSSATISRGGKPEQGPFYILDGQALPAAGAVFKPSAYTAIPPEARRLHLIATYVAGTSGVNGSVKMRVLWQVTGTEERQVADVYEAIIDGTTIVKSGNKLSNPMYAYELIGPPVSDPGSLNFRFLSCEVPIAAIGVTVEVLEVGDTTHPGTVTIRAYTSDRV